MTSRPFVLVALIITLSSACSALGQPDLGDSSSSVSSSSDGQDAALSEAVPDDLAFATAGDAATARTAAGPTGGVGPTETDAGVLDPGEAQLGREPSANAAATTDGSDTVAESAVEPRTGSVSAAIGPNAALVGVELGTEAAVAVNRLVQALGVPDVDTGWYLGCPLDGESLDERLLQWGDLNAYFDRSEGGGTFVAWGYDLRIADDAATVLDLVELPGGARLGDPINEVASAAGFAVVTDDVFGVNRVGGNGYEILSDPPPGAPAWGAFVPAIPLCE